MTPPPIYKLQDVRKKQGDSFVLDVPELIVTAGDTLCLVGPTGAGKSTLLRLLSTLEKPTSGSLLLKGADVHSDGIPVATLRQLATVHQRPLLLTGTLRYNVEYGLKVRGLNREHDRIDTLLTAFGLDRLAKQDARTLSGGQVQLVALARALAVEPAILLLDEPTAHLDPSTVASVERVVREHQPDSGMTVIWATHNLFQARRMASQVALLLNGQMVEVAETTTFFEHPHDERTADFVQGKMVY